MIKITLKHGKEESLQRRHPWIFSGAIHSTDSEPQEGDMVEVYTSQGNYIATGHCCVGSIAVRVLSFTQQTIDQEWWNRRIGAALNLRRALGLIGNPDTNLYRLVHGEGDDLPGLIVDIYGNTAVMQAHTVGMHLSRTEICEALRHNMESLGLSAIYDKSSGTIPFKSGVEATDGYLWGSSNPDAVVENGHKFYANWEDGQKTGFFIDQRENRALLGHYAHGRRVLNTFCYTGGFSIYALAGGATTVDSVDSSAKAMALTEQNVTLNFPDGNHAPHGAVTRDAMEFIRDMEPSSYDLIVLDPPAFAKHQKALGNALQGYKRLNAKAIEKIAPGGILFTFSCSQAVSPLQFRTAVFSAAAIAGRRVRILHQMTQPADHPINIYHPEGEYLKGLVVYVE